VKVKVVSVLNQSQRLQF